MEEKDYYRVLGVAREATDEEIKKAYRRLVHQYHPDKFQGDREKEEAFKRINEAYEVLRDPDKRAQYDRFGYVGAGPAPGYGQTDFGGDFQDLFGEVFSEFFGGGRRRQAPERGVDLRYDLDVNFEEAAFGAEKIVNIPRSAACETCKGIGAKPGTQPTVCGSCRGTGQARYQQGFFTISRPCSSCKGAGTVIKDPCVDCGGSGRKRITRTISVKIPAGVDSGSRLRLAGEGEPGERGGPPGDLYIVINVRAHPFFKRENDDIICEVPISFPQAALGAEIEVPTLEGPAKLKIPHGTQTGAAFRLRGKGVQSLQTGRRGDMHVIIKVETPSKLTKRQRELLEEFASISGDETTPMRKNFFSKMKEIFE